MTAPIAIVFAALDAPPRALAQYWESLSNEERARAACFTREQDRARYVAAHGILRAMLAFVLRTSPVALEFATNPYGKPYLADFDASHRLCFSMSHSGPRLALALARGREVGIDIEVARPVDCRDLESAIREFLTPYEVSALAAVPASRRERALLRLWVRAEARRKAAGSGFAARARGRFALRDLEFGPGLLAAVAAEGRGLELRVAAASGIEGINVSPAIIPAGPRPSPGAA